MVPQASGQCPYSGLFSEDLGALSDLQSPTMMTLHPAHQVLPDAWGCLLCHLTLTCRTYLTLALDWIHLAIKSIRLLSAFANLSESCQLVSHILRFNAHLVIG